MPATSLVLGTHNRKKGAELIALLRPLDVALIPLAETEAPLEVEETGDTFAANATLKAVEQARHLGAWVLGEDSGICVDALDGGPGVFSARFDGLEATDASNNRRLLHELGDLPLERRTAHYVCHVAVSDANGRLRLSAEARCYGRIRHQPVGDAGFGYDPLFEIVEYHRTFGELGEAVKSVLSHRARAIHAVIPKLHAIFAADHR